jgi:peptidoglycan hydrolase CwlO-like protein
MSSLSLRRSIVVLVAIASLFGGAAVIRAAAGWTAEAAPLSDEPPDPVTLVSQLRAEQAHAGLLADQLTEVTSQANELKAALEAAQAKAQGDAASADELAAQLASAQARLASLEKQLAKAAAAPPPVVTVSAPTSTATSTGGGESGEGSDDHEDDD